MDIVVISVDIMVVVVVVVAVVVVAVVGSWLLVVVVVGCWWLMMLLFLFLLFLLLLLLLLLLVVAGCCYSPKWFTMLESKKTTRHRPPDRSGRMAYCVARMLWWGNSGAFWCVPGYVWNSTSLSQSALYLWNLFKDLYYILEVQRWRTELCITALQIFWLALRFACLRWLYVAWVVL